MNKIIKKIRFGMNAFLVIAILGIVGSGDLYLWALNRMLMD